MSDQLSSDLASLKISRDEAPPPGNTVKYIVGAAVVVAGGIAAYAVGKPYLESRIFKPEVGVTEIALVSPAQSSVQLTATGYVVPQRTSKVSAKVMGRIVELTVDEGDKIEAGAVIAKLDDTDQRAGIASAQARVFAAQARVEAARATLAEAKLQAERARALADKGAAPKATAEDQEARLRSAEESVRASEAEAKSAQAEVRSLEIVHNQMTITAPISGTVVSRNNHVGELVGQELGGTPILELADFSSLMVEVDVPEGRLHMVKAGGPAEIMLDAFPGRRHRGSVKEIVPKVNRAKAAVTVKVAFVDPVEDVFPDMSARVSFLEKELDAAQMKEPPKVIVPSSAVAQRAGADVVFVLDGDRLRMATVTLGEPFGSGRQLVQGPPHGTKIVNNPSDMLRDGQSVKEKH